MSSQHAASDGAYGPTQCQNCGHHVTDAYRRVRGLDGKVYACPFCDDDHEHTEREIAGLPPIGGGESR